MTTATTSDESSLDVFTEEFDKQLRIAHEKHPEVYMFPASRIPDVVDRMRAAFIRGSYNKDGAAIRATCKVLGIKYTYAAINLFIGDRKEQAKSMGLK